MLSPAYSLNLPAGSLSLKQPRIMGILNITPDSFSDGGKFLLPEAAADQAARLVAEGADILDVGGESTRPGAEPVSVEDELARVMPVIEALVAAHDAPVSIDTSKPEVMRAAVAAGAAMINDVAGLRAPGALQAAAECGVPVCIMHMQGEPRIMQKNPEYQDVVIDISEYFSERIAACETAGIARENIVLDPGFGFGKTLEHNLGLMRRLEAFRPLGCPLLIGVSRKTFLGKITGRDDPDERVPTSIAAALAAVDRGAHILRVHDVAATRDALSVWQAFV